MERNNETAVVISTLGLGGAERVAIALAARFARERLPITIITLSSAETDFYSVPTGVRRIALGVSGPSHGLSKLSANWHRVRALRRVCREIRPNLVVGLMPTSTILALLATRGLGIKVIGSERNFPGRRILPKPWALARNLLYRYADGHVAQTYEEADWLSRYSRARNIVVIPNAVSWPLASHAPRIMPEDYVSARRHLLVAVGTKSRQKGFDLLLCAFATLAAQYPDWDLAIVGPAPDDKELRQLVAANRLTERVVLPGCVGNVGDWYLRADLFVLSSRYEGFPNALLEAMAAGCPCVSFDCDTGPRDIITHEEDGLLVPAEDCGALRNGLDRLMRDKAQRAAFAARARNVRERFSPDQIFAKWFAFLEAI